MSIPVEFTSSLPSGKTQVVSTYVLIPKQYVVRNVDSRIDDVGLYSDLVRRDGESIANFRSRLLRTQTLKGGVDAKRLTDAVCNELGLGQAYLMLVTGTLNDVLLTVTETAIQVYFSGVLQKEVSLVTSDVDGYWVIPTVSGVVSGLQNVSGIIATWVNGYNDMPAMLIEPQSSLVTIVNEFVPRIQTYTLGVNRAETLPGPVLLDSVSFNDTVTYAKQITGTPAMEGEWSVDTSGRINVFSAPADIVLATYKYSLLASGSTMGLVGNGARLFNLASEDIQKLMFTASGIGESARHFLFEIRSEDRNFWGK